MEDHARQLRGYSHAHAARLARKPAAKLQTVGVAGQKPRSAPGKRAPGATRRTAGPAGARKALVDAFKQHGMKLCDGTKLNAVGKAIDCIGSVPPAVSAPITALFLSQNNLTTLHGVEQFMSLRLLSVGGNLLTHFDALEPLTALQRLRNVNLTGNPLCDQPNYRFRVLAHLPQLQVLDTTDVSAKERELAPRIAAQDKALRAMVLANHFTIQKLQRIVKVIDLRSDFYSLVLGHAALSQALTFDRIPTPQDARVDVAQLLRLWCYEDALSPSDLAALELQIMTIVARTRSKLTDHPKLRAKEFLLKLASSTSATTIKVLDSRAPAEVRQVCASWDEAFENVMALQQQRIATLQAQCAQRNDALVSSLTKLLMTEPSRRSNLVRAVWGRGVVSNGSCELGAGKTTGESERQDRQLAASLIRRTSCLPPQQQDPEQSDTPVRDQVESTRDVRQGQQLSSYSDTTATRPRATLSPRQPTRSSQQPSQSPTREQPKRHAPHTARGSELRSGDFGNRTLGEAVSQFKLREMTLSRETSRLTNVSPPPPPPPPAFEHLRRPQVFMMPHDSHTSTFDHSAIAKRPSKSATAFQSVTRSFSADDDDLDDSHALAVELNQRDSHRCSRAFGASRRTSAVDESVETASSVSAFSDASLFWRARDSRVRESHAPSSVVSECTVSALNVSTSRASASALQPAPRTKTQATRSANRSDNSRTGDDDSRHSGHSLEPTALEQHTQTIAASADRQRELAEREERYIKALIESEQRELDLRNELRSFQAKLSQYQRAMAHDRHEREQIKLEVDAKVAAVAAPKVLRRFFVRWIHYYHWSLQRTHLHRRRCFILQHDWFWRWRRKVWTQQRLRDLRRAQQLLTVRRHFAEWINLSRLSVITAHARHKQDASLVQRVFAAWCAFAKQQGVAAYVHRSRALVAALSLTRRCFQQWRKLVRHQRQLHSAVVLQTRRSHRMTEQLAFCRWKMAVLVHARPLRAKVAQFVAAKCSQQQKRALQSWRHAVKSKRLHAQHLQRRVWRRWSSVSRASKSDREATLRTRRTVLRVHLQSWRATAQDRVASRRSLSLAKRYVTQRRLRKLWLYWKCYTLAKRKYLQGSTKALKHYFIKLLRRSWQRWTLETRANIMDVREQKRCDLRRHWHALRASVRLVATERCRGRLLAHLSARRDRAVLRRLVQSWRHVAQRRRRSKQYASVIAQQSKRDLVQRAWRQWTMRCLVSVRSKLSASVKEKHEMEADVLIVSDRAVSLSEHIASLECSLRDQESEIAGYQTELLQSEELRVALEAKLKAIEAAHDHDLKAWRATEAQLKDERASQLESERSLAATNERLQTRAQELEAEVVMEQQRVVEMAATCEQVRRELARAADEHARETNRLAQSVEELKRQLEVEQHEKDETASRLQEYEQRLATTCLDISQHEEAQQRETERLRTECNHLDARVREEQVRSAELQQLVDEKNEQIRQLLQQQRLASAGSLVPEQSPSLSPDTVGLPQDTGQALVEAHVASQQRRSANGQHCDAHRSERVSATQDPSIGALLKDINESILSRTALMDVTAAPISLQRSYDRQQLQSPTRRDVLAPRVPSERPPLSNATRLAHQGPIATGAAALAPDDAHIDDHTSKIHDDIRQLQARIANRLKRPAVSSSPNGSGEMLLSEQNTRSLQRRWTALPSPSSSCSSLLDQDDETETEQLMRAAHGNVYRHRSAATTARRASKTAASKAPRKTVSEARENVASVANTLPTRAGARRVGHKTAAALASPRVIGTSVTTASAVAPAKIHKRVRVAPGASNNSSLPSARRAVRGADCLNTRSS